MSFPASDSIAADHPDLAGTVRALDALLVQLGPEPFLAGRIADHLDLEPGVLFRLLHVYERGGVVEAVDAWLCPQDDALLEPDDEGALWCDLCAEAYDPDECERVTAYRLLVVAPLQETEPGPRGAIRDLLLAAFTEPEFRQLFFYTEVPALREMRHEFSTHDGLATIVDKAIEWCAARGMLRTLLREVERANPTQYEAFRGRLRGVE